MPVETLERQIGAHTYRIEQLGAKKGLEVFARFFQLLAPAFSGILEGASGIQSLGDVPTEAIAKGIKELASRALAEELEYFYGVFIPRTRIKPAGASDFTPLANVAEAIFMGKVHELLQLLWFHAEENFGGFLAGFAAIRDRAGIAATVSPSPNS